jgi:5-formyltetrahydrofolate cyclo-ligase
VKKELRANLRRILADLAPADIKEKSSAAAALLFHQPEWKKAEILMLFLSLPNEIDTTPIALRAWQERKRVLAPKISWEQRRLLPIQIDSLADDVMNSPLGIREPANGVPIPVADIDLVIVPGLGFDPLGNRLGRGRGFFDRFLAHKDFRGIACALCFEEQFVDQVPAGPHDIPVDMLVTDKHVRRFGR